MQRPDEPGHRHGADDGNERIDDSGRQVSLTGQRPGSQTAAQPACCHPKRDVDRRIAHRPIPGSMPSAASLPVIRVEALGLRIALRHVLAVLGLAVVLVAAAVIDLGVVVGPDLAGAAARGLRHRLT